MKTSQKIQVRQSEIRERLGAISELEGDDLTEAVAGERASLLAELKGLEGQLQAAMASEQLTRDIKGGQAENDGEGRAVNELLDRGNLGQIYANVLEQRSEDGAEREVQQHFGLSGNQIPIAMIAGHAETRNATVAPAETQANQQTTLQAVFPMAAASWLSVDMPTVGVGQAVYPVLTQSANPGTPAKGAAQAASQIMFSADALNPGRVQAEVFYSREDRAVFRDLDMSLRMNLNQALGSLVDKEVIQGPNGILNAVTAPTAPTDNVNYSYFKRTVYGGVDGIYAGGVGDLMTLIGPETLAEISFLYVGGSANPADSLALDLWMMRNTGGLRVSAHIPARASDLQSFIVRRGMRRDAVCPLWEGITLIPDEITKSAEGQIRLVAVLLFACKVIRTDGFLHRQIKFAS